MRILFVSLFLPQERAYHAGGRYVFELLRRLSLSHELHLVTRFEEGEQESLALLEPYCASVHPYRYPRLDRRGPLALARLAGNYLSFSSFANGIIQKGGYDLVQVEWVETAILIHRGGAPMVLDAHDVIGKPAEREFRRSRGLKRPLRWLAWQLVRGVERAIMSRFDRIFTLSDFDRRYLLELAPRLPVTAVPIPAGLDLKPGNPPRMPHRLLFLASYKYRPKNVEGALWFHRQVLPLVRQEFPDAEFVIAGYGPPEALRELAGRDPLTVVTGFVEDTSELYRSAGVFVAPILTGGGIIVKVLDALAAGTPVVTTSFGNEGIAARPGEDLLVADDPRAFADAVLALFKDPALASRISAQGALFVAENYSVDAVLGRMEAAYRELIGS